MSLVGGETATYEFAVAFGTPRNGRVAVEGVPAGELTVASRDEPSPTPASGSDGVGGTGPTAVLVAVLLAALWVGRRHRNDGR